MTSVQKRIEPRRSLLGASVDVTDALWQAADRRSGGGERIMSPWAPEVVPNPGHPPPRGQSRVASSGVRAAADGSGSGFPDLGTVSEKVR